MPTSEQAEQMNLTKMGPRKIHVLLLVLLWTCAVRSKPLPGQAIELLFPEPPPEQEENESLPKPQQNRVEEGDFFEGDIRLKPGEDPYNIFHRWMQPRTVRSNQIPLTPSPEVGSGEDIEFESARLWPGKRIPYKWHEELGPGNTRRTFFSAMQEWASMTCIQFVLANENDTDYLLLTDQKGYSSFVGRDGGEQEVSIKPVQTENNQKALGHALHEIGHAIGMWHEHSRPDRNMYVKINYAHIKENKQINFGLLFAEQFAQVPDVGYDYQSIMHYGPYAFSSRRGTLPTIEIHRHVHIPDCALALGQRKELSFKDILRANRLYSCHDEIDRLLAMGDDCLISLSEPTRVVTEPTPTTTTTSSPTTVVTPTPVTPSTPSLHPTAPNDRISTGDVITLNFFDNDRQAVECTIERDCHQETCGTFFGCSTQQQFEIYFTEVRKSRYIKNGDTVVVRSRDKRHLWLDCTRGYCTLTHDCSNNEEGYYNASNISECDNHTFRVYSKRRDRDNRSALRTNEPLVFQHEENNTYLNCQDKKCQMVPEEGICENDSLQDSADPSSGCLLPQFFRIDLPES